MKTLVYNGPNGDTSIVTRLLQILPLFILVFTLPLAQAEPIRVLYPQGSAHGFVEVETLGRTRIAVGDLTRRLRGDVVTSRLTMKFFDGSLDDETTVFSQDRLFHLISDHHVQRGPSFPQPIDVSIDATNGEVISTDENGKMTRVHVEMPADIYNGLTSSIVMNVSPTTPETRIAIVVGSSKPRIVHLSIKNAGEASFTLGGLPRKATSYLVHVEIGGVAGVVAPLVGKEPADYHLWITTGSDPAFIREEGELYEGGPVSRIQQISPAFPSR
jgi:hypothetical protein